MCNVWGGDNYVTFDGKKFDFSKNCTYYLVKEIINKYNLTITVENGCDTSDTILCPDILTVIYGSTEVVFKTKLVNISVPILEVRNYAKHFKLSSDSISNCYILQTHRYGLTVFFNMLS